jgi:hypothetical protein
VLTSRPGRHLNAEPAAIHISAVRARAVDLVAETTRAFFVPCAQIGLYVCVAPGEFGKQTDPLMPMSAWFDSGPTTVLDVSHPHERSCPLTHIINKNH